MFSISSFVYKLYLWFVLKYVYNFNGLEFKKMTTVVHSLYDYKVIERELFRDKVTFGRLLIFQMFTDYLCEYKPQLAKAVRTYNIRGSVLHIFQHAGYCVCDECLDDCVCDEVD